MINTNELLRELHSLRELEESQGVYRNEITYTDVIDIINRITKEENICK
jgi:hypothetical protein